MQAFELVWSTAYITALLAVAISDSLYRRIPNSLSMTVLAMGISYWGTHMGLAGLPWALGGAAAGGCALLVMYLMGWVGAADVKVAVAFGALLGPWQALAAVWCGFVVCGVMSLGYLSPRFHWRGALTVARAEGRTVPMGAALAAGVAMVTLRLF